MHTDGVTTETPGGGAPEVSEVTDVHLGGTDMVGGNETTMSNTERNEENTTATSTEVIPIRHT